ncbi:MAG: error-prone DNA polymerase, partial [Mycobacteriales bacterium]
PIPWSELERRLAGRARPDPPGDGGDSPAWSRHREPFASPIRRRHSPTPYAELHCHSNFSFLDGASDPEELAETAAALGLQALALTDHDGFYGVCRFAEAAAEVGLPTVFGAELSLGLSRAQNGVADPEGSHLVVLARDPEGYARLAAAISAGQRAGAKGRPVFALDELAAAAGGHWQLLTGCRKGAVPAALATGGTGGLAAATAELDRLVAAFGREHVAVELTDHGAPEDAERIDALADLAAGARVGVVATTAAHYAGPSRGRLAAAMAYVRARRSLDEMDGWLPAAGAAYLRTGEEMATRFDRHPHAVARAGEIGRDCAFDLKLVAPTLPDCPVPAGHTEMSWLAELTWRGATHRYGPRDAAVTAYDQLEHELAMIERLGFPGYFLIVHDIVDFCRRNGILCQGRGSAANSAVCYAIGITKVDAVGYGLLFERFLSPEREGPPDIDLDIAAGRREEVIQYVYDRYGRDNAAQVANVITYRPKSAMRDMAKALGHCPGQQDAWSKRIDGWGEIADADGIPDDVVALANQLRGAPRHLGIHSGGMVICDRPVVEVCPVEWARMADRSVLQWDKDDCAATGLVKFDLLGLGMLSAIDTALTLVREHHGVEVDLATLPPDDPPTYEMTRAADTVGVFQIESRAQMAALPRLKPKKFYDLVIEVALIRPGPIQGGSVHPYIRRYNGLEEPTYAHPVLRKSLEKTLGVPLFQEQMMQMAIDAAGCTPAEADLVRRAMGSKRSTEKMEKMRERLYAGMAANGITGAVAEEIFDKLKAFANFGFAESHAISFAYLVYASCWLKRYYPAAFYAALLANQPMGFYSPQSLVADARRHGLSVRGPDINVSGAQATLEPGETVPAGGLTPLGRGEVEPIIRLGLTSVRRLGDAAAERVVALREQDGRYADMPDVARRTGLSAPALEALATADAFASFGLDRRGALWAAGAVAADRPDRLAGLRIAADPPALPAMTPTETTAADLWSTGVSADSYPTQYVRGHLDELGVVSAARLREVRDGTRVLVGGVVTHRQRPATASGITFLNLEDETGMVNVICPHVVWQRYRRIARESGALIIRGKLESADGVVGVLAERFERLPLAATTRSRDFR